MIERQQSTQQYGEARTRLDQLIAFAEAVWPHTLVAVLAALQADTDAWLAARHAFQQTYCWRCGAYFADDLLGTAVYAARNGTRFCALCYDQLAGDRGSTTRRLARRIVYAQEQPERCAALLVAAQRERQLSDRQRGDLARP